MMTSLGRGALWGAIVAVLVGGTAVAQPPGAMPGRPAEPKSLAMTDQFGQKADLADHRGAVVVLVYADRRGTDASRALGEQLHVCWHPTAKGQGPAAARTAPVVGLTGLPQGQASPDVRVIPVACCGRVPELARGVIRGQIAKGAPEVPVWLDFADAMKTAFGLTAGEPNVVVFDAAGRLRMKVNGAPDQAALDRLVKAVQNLRYEAVSGK